MLTIFEHGTEESARAVSELSRRGEADLSRVEAQVRGILREVRERGDEALLELSERFDGRRPDPIRIPLPEVRARADEASEEVRGALQQAADRIRAYHEHQKEPGFRYSEDGIELGLRVLPVRAAGVYAPGGKARYPSTVLMAAVPASVAGVPRIVLATPNPTPDLCAAAIIAGVTEVLDLGGAQAIGALAYGTESVDPVDKIVGPGNIYVACAKRLVFGTVDIDQIAGPSEILVVADDEASPRVVAADLLSQAEHDEDAYPILVTVSRAQAHAVDRELEKQLVDLPRKEIAKVCCERNGYCFVTPNLEEAARVADALAPEHLALAVRDPDALLPKIRAAGAAFLGDYTPEAAGDYAAGPSHVLPTGGAARFGSPLGVYDFLVRTSIIRYDRAALMRQSELLKTLARLEGLEGHARAVAYRCDDAL